MNYDTKSPAQLSPPLRMNCFLQRSISEGGAGCVSGTAAGSTVSPQGKVGQTVFEEASTSGGSRPGARRTLGVLCMHIRPTASQGLDQAGLH